MNKKKLYIYNNPSPLLYDECEISAFAVLYERLAFLLRYCVFVSFHFIHIVQTLCLFRSALETIHHSFHSIYNCRRFFFCVLSFD